MQIEESEILFWDDVYGREEIQVSPHVQNQSICMKTAVRQNGMKRRSILFIYMRKFLNDSRPQNKLLNQTK